MVRIPFCDDEIVCLLLQGECGKVGKCVATLACVRERHEIIVCGEWREKKEKLANLAGAVGALKGGSLD